MVVMRGRYAGGDSGGAGGVVVSEGGSAAGRDASAGEEFVKSEGIVDALGVEKFGSIFGKRGR
jgi:hypothetical protein